MLFHPTTEWQRVPKDAILPPGCEIRMSMATGRNEARLRQSPQTQRVSWWRLVFRRLVGA